jgi:hypothetical protein
MRTLMRLLARRIPMNNPVGRGRPGLPTTRGILLPPLGMRKPVYGPKNSD